MKILKAPAGSEGLRIEAGGTWRCLEFLNAHAMKNENDVHADNFETNMKFSGRPCIMDSKQLGGCSNVHDQEMVIE